MFYTPPRIVAVDDNPIHLTLLAKGLTMAGAECTPLHFENGSVMINEPLEGVRIIFMDIELIPGTITADYKSNFTAIVATIGKILSTRNGPYLLIAWTEHPDVQDGLKQFMSNRIPHSLMPVAFLSLSKSTYLSIDKADSIRDHFKRYGRSANSLAKEISKLVRKYPSIAAILNWETRAMKGASNTVSEITRMVAEQESSPPEMIDGLGLWLRRLGEAAVGPGHLKRNELAAVSEALGPLLFDRIGNIAVSAGEKKVWKAAIPQGKSAAANAKQRRIINTMLHYDLQIDNFESTDPGAVIELRDNYKTHKGFKGAFGVGRAAVGYGISPQYAGGLLDLSKTRDANNRKIQSDQTKTHRRQTILKNCQWILLEISPPCDHALNKPRLYKYVLGLLAPAKYSQYFKRSQSRPLSHVILPEFQFKGKDVCLALHLGYVLGTSQAKIKTSLKFFRIRSQLLTDVLHKLSAYSSRPGFISIN